MEKKMFCYQCQETAKNSGCTINGVCGKKNDVAALQDLLIYVLKGAGMWYERAQSNDIDVYDPKTGHAVAKALFSTITNANFDDTFFVRTIREILSLRTELRRRFNKEYWDTHGTTYLGTLHDAMTWEAQDRDDIVARSIQPDVSILATEDEDIRSLRELALYGLKGIAAYADHAHVLGEYSDTVYRFLLSSMGRLLDDSCSTEELTDLVMKVGGTGVETMKVLDGANTGRYGHPEITEVSLGVRDNQGILISGHDLKDLEELLDQTEGSGIDVYTHSEMLPAQAYPFFRKYDHFAGNYGNAWWKQKEEFNAFNGPVLMTTNCIVPPDDSYRSRVFTTGNAGFPDVTHIPDGEDGAPKDFAPVIEAARRSEPPKEIESGSITVGFARNQVMALADKVIDAVKSGAVKRFVVMAGCDGRHKERGYFTDVAEQLPEDTIILTAGCAKYRYNKLDLGAIGGIPRVLDAGQCNDSYSLAYIALKLKDAFELDDINDLPISYDIAWYEQKAVLVLLALLSLGVKGIRLGPTLPAFLSENVASILVEKFDIRPIDTPEADIEKMMKGT